MPPPFSEAQDIAGISIILPSYNYARYLPEAIDSALAQDYPLFEVIVVDDGSTDNTASVVEAYLPAVRYVFQRNMGLSAARNTGIEAARYPFLTFLDADDMLESSMLSTLMAESSRLDPRFGIVAAGSARMDECGQSIDKKTYQSGRNREVCASDLIIKNRFVCNVLARREVFAECGLFDVSLRSSEDRDMWIRAAEKFRIYLVAQPLARIRRHESNMSKQAARMDRNMRQVLRNAWNRRSVPRTNLSIWLRALSFQRFEMAWMLHDEGRFLAALSCLVASIGLWPWFSNPNDLNEPALFRVRALARFCLRWLSGTRHRAVIENPPRCAVSGKL